MDFIREQPGRNERIALEAERRILEGRMPHLSPYDARRLDELQRLLGPKSTE